MPEPKKKIEQIEQIEQIDKFKQAECNDDPALFRQRLRELVKQKRVREIPHNGS